MNNSIRRILARQALAIAVVAGYASVAAADGDVANGKMLSRDCAMCHGIDGNARSTSVQVVPMLAGQPASYLVQEMENYVAGIREDTSRNGMMTRKLMNLSESDFADLAAFYEAQERF